MGNERGIGRMRAGEKEKWRGTEERKSVGARQRKERGEKREKTEGDVVIYRVTIMRVDKTPAVTDSGPCELSRVYARARRNITLQRARAHMQKCGCWKIKAFDCN